MIILEDELWSEYVRSESPREIIKWHRDRLVSLLIGESENLPQRKQFYLSVLSALRVRRNRLAHQSKSDVDDYFLPAALSLYGLAIQFRFHAYLLWLEWCMKVKMRDSNPDGGIMALENAFGEGWLEEFNTWSHLVPAHFEEIAGSGKSYQKFLCLGAGFSGLPFTSQDSQPVMPISKRLDKSIRGFLGATQIRQGASQSVPVRE